tara:strand:- start:609 stop:1592 length:984 start_codon:yes stop_codon:yes gene_type:complete
MNWKDQAIKYAKQISPEESCGLVAIINGKETFWPCKNLSNSKYEFFVIDPNDWAECEDTGEIIGIFHSHPIGVSTPSKNDIESCEFLNVPYYIYSIENNDWSYYKPSQWKAPSKTKKVAFTENDNSTKLNKIKVYGKLRQDLGCSYFEAAVKSPTEAYSFLAANFPDLEKYMSQQYYTIKMNGNVLTEDELTLQSDGLIQIIPVATGSFFNFILGVGSLLFKSAVPAKILGSSFLATAATSVLTTVGTNMVIGGVTQMLSPTKNITSGTNSASDINRNDANLKDSNYSFSGIANISRAGVTLPLVYGEILVGSVLVSNGVDTSQVTN